MDIHQNVYEETVTQVTQRLAQVGLQIERSLEVQALSGSCANTQCPQHVAPACAGHLAVFLIYGTEKTPVTLLVRGCSRQADCSLVNTPQQPADAELEARITAVLAQTSGTFS